MPPPSTVSTVRASRFGVIVSKSCSTSVPNVWPRAARRESFVFFLWVLSPSSFLQHQRTEGRALTVVLDKMYCRLTT